MAARQVAGQRVRASRCLQLALLLTSFTASALAAAPGPVRDLAQWCELVTPRLPRVERRICLESGLTPTGGLSSRQIPIFARRIAPHPDNPDALRILMVGGIHGDELTSSAVVFEWLRLQMAMRRQDFVWQIVPLLNPDGMLAARPTRMNANGVDLNRNFPTPGWHQEAPAWWVDKTRRDPRRYPGKAPLSEPESRWLHQEIERFRPDLVVSVHAPFGVLDFDGPAPPPERFGSLRIDRVGVYPGSLGNYAGHHKKVPVVTIELPHATRMPGAGESRRIWEDMQRWMVLHLRARPRAGLRDHGAPH